VAGVQSEEISVMGGLIEIAGIEVNAIDTLLYVWFVLAGASTAYVARREPPIPGPTA
jgi:hypothetical protein